MNAPANIFSLLKRAGIPEPTLIVIFVRIFSAVLAVKSELRTLRWYAIITLYHAIHWIGLHAVAEWFSRVSGLRAQLESAIGEK